MTPLKGSQTDRNTQKNNQDENDFFETTAPEKDNRVRKEFEIRELGNDELKEDELARYASLDGAPRNNKLSERKFLGTQI